ncbi:AAA family ATPase [Roseateles sp.]|uniref:AAA family ATPase n=1 Tax=Roseateles sp. TaxID=1971397 RepID=UPI0031CF56CD
MIRCQACAADNRAIARFCKRCGEALPPQGGDALLGRLIGLAPIRQALTELTETVEGMRLAGRDPRSPFATLIVGDSGTAKTRLGYLIAETLVGLKLTDKPTPVLVDALQPEELEPKSLAAQFDAAKGGVLFVDNAHKLVSDEGDPQPALHLLMQRAEQSPLDPVLIMAGLPYGLKELLDKTEHRNLVGRLRNIFRIADYDPPQLTAIAERDLSDKGFALSDATRDRLAMRMRWLQRRLKSGDTSIRSVNGRLALDEAAAIERSYYRRKGPDRQLLPEDIQGEVEQRKSIDEILVELNGFVGMTALKEEVALLHKDIETARRRQALGMGSGDDSQHAFHFTLTGNPGTGKTTVARVLGDVFEALGVLPSGHVVEVDRGKLVGQWQGHTATRVNAACDQAIGGILFIDEAYALCGASGNDSFGQEAVDTLLKRMEDDRGKYIVIAAGYRDQIADFLGTNPGLQSRFQRSFHLDDYTPDELTEILARLAGKEKLVLDAASRAKVRAFFADRCARKSKDFANGREARNLLTTIKRAQSERLRRLPEIPDAAQLAELRAEDIPGPASAGSGQSIDEILAELDGMIGLSAVKETVRDLQAALSRARALNQTRPLAQHFLFTGAPGTGKTTVARIMARIFHALGLLPTDRVIEVDRGKLIGQYQGQTAPRVHDACDQALGGILFIDEAYALCNSAGGHDSFGQEAVDTLLKRMEDDRGKFIVIAAGYDREMQVFLDSNSGLRSRFTDTVFFPDYTPDEMRRIFQSLAAADGVALDEDAQPLLLRHLEAVFARRDRGFANGRTVRQLYERVGKITGRRAEALVGDPAAYAQALRTILPADIEALGIDRTGAAAPSADAAASADARTDTSTLSAT